MVIGFDAKRVFANYTGLGNYSRYVIRALSENFPDNQYRLYAPKNIVNTDLAVILDKENITSVFPQGIWSHLSSYWRTKAITKDLFRDGVELYHGLSNELPVGIGKKGIASVVTIHDLIFLRYPEYYKTPDRMIYNRKFKYACQASNRIIAISECTKRDIVSYYHISPDKIQVVYQGCDPKFREKVSFEEKKQVCEKYGLPETFMLNVGTIEPRKNLLLAVKSLLHLDKSIHLVVIGRLTPYALKVKSYIAQHGLEGRVHFLQGVPLSDLPALYQSASVFVYPSLFEGFGIPILEALCSEVPIIAATGSCLEEAGGSHSIYVNPEDDTGLASAVDRVVSDIKLQATMIAEGKKHASLFNDKRFAEQTMSIYQSLV